MRIAIGHYTATSAAGIGLNAMHQSIAGMRSGLIQNDLDGCDLETWVGRVPSLEDTALPPHLAHLESRNNRLAWLSLQQDGFPAALEKLVDRVGLNRVGVVMGTSTSSIGRTEEAYTRLEPSGLMPEKYAQPEVHNLHSPGIFVSLVTGLKGPSMTINTACSSSAKVFASAGRPDRSRARSMATIAPFPSGWG